MHASEAAKMVAAYTVEIYLLLLSSQPLHTENRVAKRLYIFHPAIQH